VIGVPSVPSLPSLPGVPGVLARPGHVTVARLVVPVRMICHVPSSAGRPDAGQDQTNRNPPSLIKCDSGDRFHPAPGSPGT